MKPLTLALGFAAVTCLAASQLGNWKPPAADKKGAASNCAQAPMSANARDGSAEDQQQAILATAECVYHGVGPVGAAIMKKQGVDPGEVLDQIKSMQSEIGNR